MRIFALSWLTTVVMVLDQSRIPSFALLVILALILLILACRYPISRTLIAGIVVGIASISIHLVQIGSAQLSESVVSEDLTLRVQIVGVPSHDHRRVRFDADVIECISCSQNFGPKRIQLSWYRGAQELHGGEVWTMTVRLKPLGGLRNPDGFDVVRWGLAKGLHAKGYIRASPPPVREQSADRLNLSALRERVATRLSDLRDDAEHIGLVQALTVGVKDGVAKETWTLLRNTGTAHLLAISGLHISLVAGWGFIIGRLLAKPLQFVSLKRQRGVMLDPRSISLLLSMTLALVYAILSGFELPTQRAVMMLLVWIIASWCFRFLAPASALALALIGVLFSNALSPLSVGFWLSFGTVWILFLLHRGRQRPRSMDSVHSIAFWRRSAQLAAVAKTHVLLGVILLPISAWFFQTGSLIAPLANLLAVPWLGFVVVPLCFLSAVLSLGFPAAAAVVLHVADWSLTCLLEILSALSVIGKSAVTLTVPDSTGLALCLLGLICAIAPYGLALRWLALPLVIPALVFNIHQRPVSGFEVHVLDVGQGLAVLILSEHQTLLYDTGNKVSESFSMFEAVVVPYLHGQGRRTIDTLVLSHADADHSAGAADVVRHYPDVDVHGSAPVSGLIGTDFSRCEAGQSWSDGDVHFSFVHPGASDSGSENDLSCVLLIHLGSSRVLLPGDIENIGESLLTERLLSSTPSFPVSLIVAPHHGSITSSAEKLLDVLKPEYVVFPAGRANLYGFPHADVQLRYTLLGAESYVTGVQGAVSFVFGPDGLRQPPETWWQSHRRFWHGIVNPVCSPEDGTQTHWLRLLWLAQKGQILCGK